jgi:hypothetical protein
MSRKLKPKSLLFILEWGLTIGDHKPMAILAVYAAWAAANLETPLHFRNKFVAPVTLTCRDSKAANWLPAIEKFAKYTIGEEYKKWIDIQYNILTLLPDPKEYFTFGVSFMEREPKDKTIYLDFGDSTSVNRFTSKLLAKYRPHSHFFGSLFLPLGDVAWSSLSAISELNAFVDRNKGRHIMTIAGSLRPPFALAEVEDWVEKHKRSKRRALKWAFVLVGYPKINDKRESNEDDSSESSEDYEFDESSEEYEFDESKNDTQHAHQELIVMQNAVEYEDLLSRSDFFVSNCGAGSVAAGFAAGCPQLCRTRGTKGSDKSTNEKVVSKKLRVGPREYDQSKKNFLTFSDLMDDLELNYTKYLKRAQAAKTQIRQEHEDTTINVVAMFDEILQDSRLQQEIERTGILPTEFALD